MSIQDGKEAVGGFIEAMKGQPLSLALVLMNIILLYVLWSIYTSSVAAHEKEMQLIFTAQKDVQTLLSKCVVPDK